MKIQLCEGQFGWDYLIIAQWRECKRCGTTFKLNRKTCPDCGAKQSTQPNILIQTDWEYPATASTFGWIPCSCGQTDGTVNCKHKTASEMISEAGEYLDEHIGDVVDDPGYFDGVG